MTRIMKPQFIKEKDKNLTWCMKNVYSDEYVVMDYVVALENKYKNSVVSYYISGDSYRDNQTYIPFIRFKDDSDEAEFIIQEISS